MPVEKLSHSRSPDDQDFGMAGGALEGEFGRENWWPLLMRNETSSNLITGFFVTESE